MFIFDWSPETWGAIGSGATALTFGVSAWVLRLQLKDRRRSDAENVTVWVRDEYQPNSDGVLVRSSDLHLTNVGSRPVFDVQVVVGHGFFGHDTKPLGPIAVPTLPVLGPGVHETWPIADALTAVPPGELIRAEVSCRDSANRWWRRNFEGKVRRWYRPPPRRVPKPIADSEVDVDQFGPMSLDNPIAVAMAFYATLDDIDTPEGRAVIERLCAPESVTGWGDFSAARDALEGNGLAAFPSYPVPGVAYVKFPDDVDTALRADGPTIIAAQIMTLQLRPELDPPGWRVFALGSPVPPDQLPPVPHLRQS